MNTSRTSGGAYYALLAYGSWGLVPLYWHLLGHIPAPEILSHRVVWSTALLVALLAWRRQLGAFFAALRPSRALALACTSALLIGANWGIYLHAVTSGHLLESSLGYFINPLVNVMLGVAFLKESLRPMQKAAVALALAGVSLLVFREGVFPWIALSLSLTFGFYGLVRKVTPLPSLIGSAVESSLLAPLALLFLAWITARGEGHFLAPLAVSSGPGNMHATRDSILLVVGGAVTAFPLLWFSEAAKRLTLIVLGFFQFLAPTLQFLTAVLVFHERFTPTHAASFACIWAALGLNVWDAQRSKWA